MLSNDPFFEYQWHLKNEGQSGGTAGIDLDVQAAWQHSRGENVVIGFVADGLQDNHPDLQAQFLPGLSHNFVHNNSETWAMDSHDTAVAGIAVASGDNDLGVSGVSPEAQFATLRIDTSNQGAQQVIANALSHQRDQIDIYSNSWGPWDSGKSLEGPSDLVLNALKDGVTHGRNGLGSIYVWAGGNGLAVNDNVNYDGYASSRYTIAVSGVDHHGQQGHYSEPGAAIFVASFGGGNTSGIATTDLFHGNGEVWDGYTPAMGMTSASTAVASGVVALMLGANPNLSWRDVQHILANTAYQNDAQDSDWIVNGGGHHINHKYGFGLIDAGAAVAAATQWQSVASEVAVTSGEQSIQRIIPDNSATGISAQVTIDSDIQVEWAEVKFEASHSYRGDLEVALFSPDGTQSILAERHDDGNADYDRWLFSSMRHWGESAQGDWTLRVSDRSAGDVGTWESWQLNLYGTSDSGENPQPPVDPPDDPQPPTNPPVEPPSNVITDSAGTNYLAGTSGADYLQGLDGNDYMEAGSGDDYLLGSSAELRGHGEWDYLIGGAGSDTFVLGDGSHAYYGANGYSDVAYIEDFDERFDHVWLHGEAADYRLENNVEAGEAWLYLQASGDAVAGFDITDELELQHFSYLLGGGENPQPPVDPPDNPLPPTPPTNDPPSSVIADSSGANYLAGTSGDDFLQGLGGNDYMEAGHGDDYLLGSSAALRGHGEWDHLIGGAGHDTFVLGDTSSAYYGENGYSDVAYIEDFDVRYDRVLLHGSSADYRLDNSLGQGVAWLYLNVGGDAVAGFDITSALKLQDFHYV